MLFSLMAFRCGQAPQECSVNCFIWLAGWSGPTNTMQPMWRQTFLRWHRGLPREIFRGIAWNNTGWPTPLDLANLNPASNACTSVGVFCTFCWGCLSPCVKSRAERVPERSPRGMCCRSLPLNFHLFLLLLQLGSQFPEVCLHSFLLG